MKKIMMVFALIAGTLMLGGSPASAHTPGITADCNGVTATMVNAPDGFKSILTVTVAGKTLTKEIVGNGSLTAPVPQDGATSAWSAAIDNVGFSDSRSGDIGPCGKKPVVVPDKPTTTPVVTSEHAVNCTEYSERSVTTTPTYTYDKATNKWVKGADEAVKGAWANSTPTAKQLEEAGLTAECAPPAVPDKPATTPVVASEHEVNCTAYRERSVTTTPTYTLVNNEWVKGADHVVTGEWVSSAPTSNQLDAADLTCEVVEPPADVDVCPLVPGNQPEDTDCGEDVSPPGDENPPAVTPPAENPRVVVTVTARTPAANAPVKAPVAASAGVLPNTGGTNMAALLAGLAFMFMGAFALVCGSRRPRKN